MHIMSILAEDAAMKTMTARDAKNNFGEMMEGSSRELVIITKHDKPARIIMSVDEYKHLKLQSLRADVREGIIEAERGEFADDNSLEGLLEELALIDNKETNEATV